MLNTKQIMEILPHRYPFLLVDKAEIVENGKGAIGYKNVTINEPFFQGHFPKEPVMPGVLIIEALAQVGAITILSQEAFKGKIAYLGSVKEAKFRAPVLPGDTLKLCCNLVKQRGSMGIGKATAYVEDKKVCECELIFAIGK
ncbi:MAG: 3-hydroxyacyl-ACP dehydratase FabZ [Cellulosilyticum sp.]|nr:3-hydroxyacyl-ACP dehydratase FabZ [Cellulosilyticum sp.]